MIDSLLRCLDLGVLTCLPECPHDGREVHPRIIGRGNGAVAQGAAGIPPRAAEFDGYLRGAHAGALPDGERDAIRAAPIPAIIRAPAQLPEFPGFERDDDGL
jgi:hypothetical protein